MNAESLLKEAKIDEALAALQEQVRAKPADAKLRVFLFQLLAVMGRWDRAMTQLNVAAEMDAGTLLMAQVCRPAIQCEVFRADVFAGKRTPLILGEPDEWVGWMVQANQYQATGKEDQAADLRGRALEAAPAVPGLIITHADADDAPGEAFEWIADADLGMGPLLEAIVDGRYYWVPMHRLSRLECDKPSDLRDMVWTPATLTLTNGGSKPALIPTRYPGTENAADGALRLARSTDWTQTPSGYARGVGVRLLATDNAEFALTQVRRVILSP